MPINSAFTPQEITRTSQAYKEGVYTGHFPKLCHFTFCLKKKNKTRSTSLIILKKMSAFLISPSFAIKWFLLSWWAANMTFSWARFSHQRKKQQTEKSLQYFTSFCPLLWAGHLHATSYAAHANNTPICQMIGILSLIPRYFNSKR